MNICMCGAQAGYLHDRDCPRPLFKGSMADEQRWTKDFERNRRDHCTTDTWSPAQSIVRRVEGGS